MNKVPFLDLRVGDVEKAQLQRIFVEAMSDGMLVLGDAVSKFEAAIADYCGRRFAVGVSSGTDALFLSLRALDIGPGDEVVTTSLSWVATANAIRMAGATPIFADVCDDLNIDPNSVEDLISYRTKAILFVNFTGKLAKIDALREIANRRHLVLIEDASQSFGASENDEMSGSFGVVSAISHNPMKVFAALGEAGSVLTDDENLWDRMVSLRYNGTLNRELCVEPSLNSRIDNLQSRFLTYRLENFMEEVIARRKNASSYDEGLKQLVRLPHNEVPSAHVFYTYSILAAERDALVSFLDSRLIETKIQHKLPIPLHPAYAGSRGQWANAQLLCSQVLCLPIHGKLKPHEIEYVIESVTEFYSGRSHNGSALN